MTHHIPQRFDLEKLAQEPPHHLEEDTPGWPSKGSISFKNVSLQYRANAAFALKDINFEIAPGTSVGIVGRTGAGKTSLVSVLFRLIDATEGVVTIDGKDTTAVGLAALRSGITIIPQMPVLLIGTVRSNLDPVGIYTDVEMEAALRKVWLPMLTLEHPILKNGKNLSSGQRQLLCFARALLLRNKIVVMDEPTASIDMATDAQIQELVSREFAGCTLLVVAHRLQTVIGYDKIMVMADGAVAEFGAPAALLSNSLGHFSTMVGTLGEADAAQLRRQATGAAGLGAGATGAGGGERGGGVGGGGGAVGDAGVQRNLTSLV